jgi:hypothetical protein
MFLYAKHPLPFSLDFFRLCLYSFLEWYGMWYFEWRYLVNLQRSWLRILAKVVMGMETACIWWSIRQGPGVGLFGWL